MARRAIGTKGSVCAVSSDFLAASASAARYGNIPFKLGPHVAFRAKIVVPQKRGRPKAVIREAAKAYRPGRHTKDSEGIQRRHTNDSDPRSHEGIPDFK